MAGDGRSDCPLCKGRGVFDISPDPKVGRLLPQVQKCQCVELRDLLANLRRGWVGLEKAQSAPTSPLRAWVDKDLIITATRRSLQAHLRYTMLRQPSNFFFSVLSDADLMDLWLQPLDRKGETVYDPDFSGVGNQDVLSHVVSSPQLLIVYLGVKAARNSAMPEVLHETILQRQYKGKPTWLADQPNRKLELGHLAYSDAVMDAIEGWPMIHLNGESSPSTFSNQEGTSSRGKPRRRTLSTGN